MKCLFDVNENLIRREVFEEWLTACPYVENVVIIGSDSEVIIQRAGVIEDENQSR